MRVKRLHPLKLMNVSIQIVIKIHQTMLEIRILLTCDDGKPFDSEIISQVDCRVQLY